MKYIYDLSNDEIEKWVVASSYPKYRAAQIMTWLNRGITQYEMMTDIPKAIRAALAEEFFTDGAMIQDKLLSEKDETIKYILKLKDGNIVECVLMKYSHGYSICISSQAGCKMGCLFCASTGCGFGRNLSGGEMLAQVAIVSADAGCRISNIVIMGIGEPLDNYNELLLFLRRVNDPEGMGIGMRHISVSTCGLVDEMLKFTDEGLPVTLSISLHAPNDEIRRKLMPIASKYPIKDLLAACKRHTKLTGRRISFEYSLFENVNDSPGNALELAALLRGMLCHVNLIPANEFQGCSFKQSGKDSIKRFRDILVSKGINATIRRELGSDISAACGQLRRNITKGVSID